MGWIEGRTDGQVDRCMDGGRKGRKERVRGRE